MLPTPVLFIVFNRPEVTKRVFQEIRKARPTHLYISADGPRQNVEGEAEKVSLAREIATNVDWDCEVKMLFHERNLGCRLSVSKAVSWLFENEKEGIILEDDCLPDQSFFQYCQELLEKYQHDTRVMAISGDNYQQGRKVTAESYYFSKYNHCWGWATWRRAWADYDLNMLRWEKFHNQGGLDIWADGSDVFKKYWTKIFNQVIAGRIDTWDYQWIFSCWAQNGLTCLPNKNLVKNIGFGEHATHTTSTSHWRATLEADELEFPLIHPEIMVRNISADIFSDSVIFGIKDEIIKKAKQSNYEIIRAKWVASRLFAVLRRVRNL